MLVGTDAGEVVQLQEEIAGLRQECAVLRERNSDLEWECRQLRDCCDAACEKIGWAICGPLVLRETRERRRECGRVVPGFVAILGG